MIRTTQALILAGAIAATSVFTFTSAPAQVAPTKPATQPAAAREQQGVPVREVVLFTSGVGYFEHFGVVQGNANTELSFKTNQINDILKSLLLEDIDGGKISVVTYGSQEPLARTLKSFEIDLSTNPSLSQILGQLRGTSVTATLADAKVSGTILGVEKKQKPAADNKLMDVWVLDLLLPTGSIRPIELDRIDEVRLEDPKLQQEMVKALGAVSAARDQDKKPVTIRFNGQGNRHVRIGYVIEAPVWKASYRLVLSDAAKNEEVGPDKGKPQQPPQNNPRQQDQADGGRLQGWAIVENQTDNDWENVQLSLVSGRPISFIEDLYRPLYIPRQVVQPELYASLQPQTYAEGLGEVQQQLRAESRGGLQRKATLSDRGQGLFGGSAGAGAPAAPEALDAAARPMNPLASVLPAASGAAIGQFFQYTVPDVALARQKSAMIPILSDGVKVRRLSIYNANVLATNPLLGARLTNTTGKLLPNGPLTILDAGVYAGDAKIDDLPNDQNRLFSYGIDQSVLVHSSDETSESHITTAKIVKGVLQITSSELYSRKYVAQNKGKTDRTLMIEHPKRESWTLEGSAKPVETTDTLYRFEESLPAGQSKTLTVQERLTSMQGIEILPLDIATLESYRQSGPIPQSVKDALGKAAQFKYALADTQKQIQDHQQRLNEFNQEQSRIRENMKAVNPNTDYYKRLLKELDDQETSIQKLRSETKDLQEKAAQQQKDLQDYLASLEIG